MADTLPPNSPHSPTADPLPPPPPPTRAWLWALVIVFIVVCVAMVFLLNIYNSQLLLSSDRLAAAQQKWRGSGIRDYNWDVVVRGGTQGEYHIEVRGGEVTDHSRLNGRPLDPVQAKKWTPDALLEDILAKELENQKRPDGEKCFSQVEFHEEHGYPTRYLHSGSNALTAFHTRIQLKDLEKPLPPVTPSGSSAPARDASRPAGTRPTRSGSTTAPAPSGSGTNPSRPRSRRGGGGAPAMSLPAPEPAPQPTKP